MEKVYIFLIDGFEETEALVTVDILRRANIEVLLISLTDSRVVVGGHQISVNCDALFSETQFDDAKLLIIPGGTVKFNEHDGLKKLLLDFEKQVGLIAAICAAPMVLGELGLLNGRQATCYPGFEQYLKGAQFVKQAVVQDGHIITARGPGFTFDFAFKIVEVLKGAESLQKVKEAILSV